MKALLANKFTALAIAALFFTGCLNTGTDEAGEIITSEETGNVNNTMEGLMQNGFDQNDMFGNAFPTIEGANTPGGSASLSTGGESAPAPLARRGSAKTGEEEITLDSSHLDEGYLLVIIKTTGIGYEQNDSLWVEWDEFARDTLEDNENLRKAHSVKISGNGVVEDITIEDADGDGIAGGHPEYNNRAKLTALNTNIFGITEKAVMVIDAGEDHDFGEDGNAAEQDNLMIEMSWERIKEGDVIAYGRFTDKDGDGILVDPSFSSPSTVGVELYETQNPFKPFVESSRLNMTVVMTEPDSDGEVISISAEETFKNGTVNSVTALDENGSDIIDAGDIVTVTLLSESPVTGDSVLSNEIRFVMDIGSGFGDSTDNMMLELHATSEKRFGLIKKEEFHFISDEPIPEGEEPKAGSILIVVTYRNGSTATLEGTFSEGVVDATLTGPEGNSVSFHWEEN